MTSALLSFDGRCHCGALGYTIQTARPVAEWSVRACQCSFCRAHGARTTSDPAGRLAFHVNQPEHLQRYRFGRKTADFLLCSHCGVYLGAQIETPRGAFGTVNTLAMTPIPGRLPAAVPADYDSEDSGDRIRRREERWTPLESAV